MVIVVAVVVAAARREEWVVMLSEQRGCFWGFHARPARRGIVIVADQASATVAGA